METDCDDEPKNCHPRDGDSSWDPPAKETESKEGGDPPGLPPPDEAERLALQHALQSLFEPEDESS